MSKQQQTKENVQACKHKEGDVWADGCCTDSIVAKVDSNKISRQTQAKISDVKTNN